MWSFLSNLIWILFLTGIIYLGKDKIDKFLNILASLLTKAKKIGFKDFNIDISETNILNIDGLSEEYIKAIKTEQSHTSQVAENTIKNFLVEKKFTLQQGLNVLISQLSSCFPLVVFGRFDNELFIEQIKLLTWLNKKNLVEDAISFSMFLDKLKNRLSNIKENKNHWALAWNIDDFLKYLIKQDLIIQNNNKFCITNTAKDYLAYRIKRGFII